MNVCLVYCYIGGYVYGGIYSGLIGVVLILVLNGNIDEWNDIVSVLSLCGVCYEVCFVKIFLYDMFVYLCRCKVEEGYGNKLEGVGMKGFVVVVFNFKCFSVVICLG